MRPMSDSLGWSRTTITAGSAFQALSNLVLAPVLGIIIDRYGPRMVMVLGACIASISYMFMTRVTEPWQFYILYTSAVSVGLYEVGNFVTTTVVSKCSSASGAARWPSPPLASMPAPPPSRQSPRS